MFTHSRLITRENGRTVLPSESLKRSTKSGSPLYHESSKGVGAVFEFCGRRGDVWEKRLNVVCIVEVYKSGKVSCKNVDSLLLQLRSELWFTFLVRSCSSMNEMFYISIHINYKLLFRSIIGSFCYHITVWYRCNK